MSNATSAAASPPNVSCERVDLPITGMSCASCSRRLEKQLGSIRGVRRAGVNFATSRATVEYDPQRTSIRDMMAEVRRTGYDTAGNAKADFVVDESRGVRPGDRRGVCRLQGPARLTRAAAGQLGCWPRCR